MTPFMHSVQDLLDGTPAPRVETVRSRPGPVPAAADTQVIIRSLAEQLVSEANAVLRPRAADRAAGTNVVRSPLIRR